MFKLSIEDLKEDNNHLIDWSKYDFPEHAKITEKQKFQRTAAKSHTCEMCGAEIHKGEHIWWYKPLPKYFKATKNRKYSKSYQKWRKRCYDCEPKSYAELEYIMSREATQGGY